MHLLVEVVQCVNKDGRITRTVPQHSETESDLLLCCLLLHVSDLLLSTGQCSLDHRKNSAQVINTPLTTLRCQDTTDL